MYKVYIGKELMWETDSWTNALEVQRNYQAIYCPDSVTVSRPY